MSISQWITKALAWVIFPLFMMADYVRSVGTEQGDDMSWLILMVVPLAVAQIAYWYLAAHLLFG